MAQRVIWNPRVEYRKKSVLKDLLLVFGVIRSSRERAMKGYTIETLQSHGQALEKEFIAPRVSMANGTKSWVWMIAEYLATLFSAALSAALLAEVDDS